MGLSRRIVSVGWSLDAWCGSRYPWSKRSWYYMRLFVDERVKIWPANSSLNSRTDGFETEVSSKNVVE